MTRLATWNINSVRLRINRAISLLQNEDIDILCLQETKTEDQHFPINDFIKAGYDYCAFSGEKSYNGVAIISRIPLNDIKHHKLVNNDCRHITATLPNNTIIHNFYIPAGGDTPDPVENVKFAHKLDYCDAMTNFFSQKENQNEKMILVGDLNIAPLEHDVWSHKQLLKIVSHTPIEIERLSNIQKTCQWIDAPRLFTPENEKLYSWWSYRNRDWRKSNRGRRLDHIWITKALRKNAIKCRTLDHLRDGEKPSDHVPVIIELK